MKCNAMPELLVSLLYDELDPEEKRKVEKHIESCEACRREYTELNESASLLEKWPDANPECNFIFVNEKVSLFKKIKASLEQLNAPMKIAFALPAAVCIIFLLLAIFNFKAGYSEGNWEVSFSLIPQQKQPTAPAAYVNSLEQSKQETLKLVQNMLQESETRQNRFYQTNMAQLATEIRQQRQKDLRMVGYGLEGLQYSTEGQLQRTNKKIEDLMHLTGYTMEKK